MNKLEILKFVGELDYNEFDALKDAVELRKQSENLQRAVEEGILPLTDEEDAIVCESGVKALKMIQKRLPAVDPALILAAVRHTRKKYLLTY